MAKKTPVKRTGPMLEVVVKAGYIESRDGIKGKKGETIQIPENPKEQSPAIRQALKSGKLKAVQAAADLPPTTGTQQIE